MRSKEQRRTGWGTLNGRARRVRRHHVSGYKAREMGQGRARGQSLPELALVLPVVLMIVLVALDFGRLFLGWVTLNNAARVAANYGAITPTPWTAAETAQYNLLLDKETSAIDCTPPNPWPEPTYPGPLGTGLGGRANVSLTCQFHLITPVFNALFPNRSLDVSASADFPVRTGALANLGGGGSGSGTPPVASFTAVPTTGTAQLTVNFTNTSTGGVPQTWLWHFADGTLDDINPTPPAHTFVAAGTYLVTLTETNGAGNSQAQALISVSDPGPAPIAAFYGTVPSPCISNPGVPSSQLGWVADLLDVADAGGLHEYVPEHLGRHVQLGIRRRTDECSGEPVAPILVAGDLQRFADGHDRQRCQLGAAKRLRQRRLRRAQLYRFAKPECPGDLDERPFHW